MVFLCCLSPLNISPGIFPVTANVRRRQPNLTLCLTFVILRSLIIFELSYKGGPRSTGTEPHRSNAKDHTHSTNVPFAVAVVVFYFLLRLPAIRRGICAPASATSTAPAFVASALIAAICCSTQQHYLRVLDFCAKRS